MKLDFPTFGKLRNNNKKKTTNSNSANDPL